MFNYLVLILFILSASIVIINLMAEPGIDYWDLDGEKKTRRSALDVLRKRPLFYISGAVLIGTFVAHLVMRG